MPLSENHKQFLASVHPYDSLAEADLDALSAACKVKDIKAGDRVFASDDQITQLFILIKGEVEITDETGVQLSLLGPRNSFGERALLRGGHATRNALITQDATLIMLPAQVLFDLIATQPTVARFFDRRRPSRGDGKDLGMLPVETLMTHDPVTCTPDTTIQTAAGIMDQAHISSICISDQDQFQGILTLRDMTGQVVAQGVDINTPVSRVMSMTRLTLGPNALMTDVLHLMVERGIGHVPIVDGDTLLGIVTQTDLMRAQAISTADLVGRVAQAADAAEMARATADIPNLLLHLVEGGNRHDVITRLVTDIADAATRRLLTLAEDKLGPPPVPYLWLACGSQGRQEQTGVSDQDNCLILSNDVSDADMPYFAELAKYVCDGLNTCGYFYCPGDMMATNPRWCQPLHVWEDYFKGWIAKPDPEAQMLASVMFDLRAIGGDETLLTDLQDQTLAKASKNSIFTAHMIANSLKHQPPLGLLRGLATIRSGEHRNQLDLKLSGVVPVVDLGRIYMLQGQLRPANTRARLEAAMAKGILSANGGADLLDAYDMIATRRLEHQAAEVRRGQKPGNHLDPGRLSDFERSHLRDAFVVVKTMQAAVGSGKGMLG